MKNLPDFFRSGSMSRTGNTNPYKEMAKLQRQLDQVFTDMWNANPVDLVAPVEQFAEFAPSCEVKETDDHYLMSFDIPGAKKEDIKIEFQDGYLMVSGERKQEFEQKGKNHYTERSYGSFCRTFELPSGVKPDQVEAHYADGVLKVAFPKVETAK
jgi:HSP20 family protein